MVEVRACAREGGAPLRDAAGAFEYVYTGTSSFYRRTGTLDLEQSGDTQASRATVPVGLVAMRTLWNHPCCRET